MQTQSVLGRGLSRNLEKTPQTNRYLAVEWIGVGQLSVLLGKKCEAVVSVQTHQPRLAVVWIGGQDGP